MPEHSPVAAPEPLRRSLTTQGHSPHRSTYVADHQRVFSDEEFTQILHTATQLANQGHREGPATDGLTLADMQAAATQVGLDPALIARAARQLMAQPTPSPFERLIGGPLCHAVTMQLPVPLSSDGAARLLSVVRINAGAFSSANPGHASDAGMAWDASGEGDILRILARTEPQSTTVSIAIDRRGIAVLTVFILGVALLMLFLFAMSVLWQMHHLLAILTVGTGAGGLLVTARRFWSSSTAKARAHISTLLDAIGQILG
jgi:hypothetical protein